MRRGRPVALLAAFAFALPAPAAHAAGMLRLCGSDRLVELPLPLRRLPRPLEDDGCKRACHAGCERKRGRGTA
jgi:hypothetical protein